MFLQVFSRLSIFDEIFRIYKNPQGIVSWFAFATICSDVHFKLLDIPLPLVLQLLHPPIDFFNLPGLPTSLLPNRNLLTLHYWYIASVDVLLCPQLLKLFPHRYNLPFIPFGPFQLLFDLFLKVVFVVCYLTEVIFKHLNTVDLTPQLHHRVLKLLLHHNQMTSQLSILLPQPFILPLHNLDWVLNSH